MAATSEEKIDPTKAAALAYEESVKDSSDTEVMLKLAQRKLFRDHGLTKVEDDVDGPMEYIDNSAVHEALFAAYSGAVVVTKTDRENVPVHRYDLTHTLLNEFPKPPSDEWDERDAVERAAWHKADAWLWGKIQIKYGDMHQRWARERLDKMVLVKTVDSVFVTAEVKYIKAEVFTPLTDPLEIQASKVGGMLGAFGKGNPALTRAGAAVLKKSVKAVGEKSSAAFLLSNGKSDDSNGNAEEE